MENELATLKISKVLNIKTNNMSSLEYGRSVVMRLLVSAIKGNIQAIKLILEIMEGKLTS